MPARTTMIRSESEAETTHAGELLAQSLTAGDVVACTGDLGTGKTRFIQGVCRGLGVPAHVTSPTFTIVNEYYSGRVPVYHFDFYRLHSPLELREIGFAEYLNRADGVALIEWAERVPEELPAVRYDVRISFGERPQERVISIEPPPGRELP